MKIVCECGFTKTCNMSGGVDESDKFNDLVTESIMAHNMNVHTTQKWIQGMNFRSKNLQGNICGINLEHRKMSNLRNQLYIVHFRNNKDQCFLGSLFGLLNDKYVSCGTVVLKRKQQLSMSKAEKAGVVI